MAQLSTQFLQYLKNLTESPSSLENLKMLVVTFPYEHLIQCKSFNYEAISILAKTMILMANHDTFYMNISFHTVIQFALNTTTKLIRFNDSHNVLENLLQLLVKILISFREHVISEEILSTNITTPIFSTIIKIIKSKQPENIKSLGAKMLFELLLMIPKKINFNLNLLDTCICQTFSNLEGSELIADLSKICGIVLWSSSQECIPEIRLVKDWVLTCGIPYLNNVTDQTVLIELLKCLIIAFTTQRDVTLKLTEKLMPAILKLCKFVRNNALCKYAKDLLSSFLEEFYYFKLSSSSEVKQFKEDVYKLPLNIGAWCMEPNDTFFVIAYLQFLSTELYWSKEQILTAIINRLSDNLPLPPQPILKTMCLLFPWCTVGRKDLVTSKVSDGFFKLMQHSNSFEQILTHHRDQMVWIVKFANNSLQRQILKIWLHANPEIAQLPEILQEAENCNLLIQLILEETNPNTLTRAVQIANKLDCNFRSNMIFAAIPRLFKNTSAADCILQLQLTVPTDPRKAFYYGAVLLSLLPMINSAEALRGACRYLIKFVTKIADEEEILKTLICSEAVHIVAKVATQADDLTAVEAIRLLNAFVVLQVKHNIDVPSSFQLDLSSVVVYNCNKSVELFQLIEILVTPRVKNPLVTLPEQALPLYISLHSVANTRFSKLAYKCLIALLKKHPYLATSACNYVSPSRRSDEDYLLFQKELSNVVQGMHLFKVGSVSFNF